MKPFGVIYRALNLVNGKSYVGQTVVGVNLRWKRHVGMAKLGRNNMLIYRAIRKYGETAFSVSVLHEAASREELDALEIQAIAEHETANPLKGYNLESGPVGTSLSESTRAKISASMKKVWEGYKSSGRRLSVLPKGFKHTDETRQKMSRSRMGHPGYCLGRRVHSDEHKEFLRSKMLRDPKTGRIIGRSK